MALKNSEQQQFILWTFSQQSLYSKISTWYYQIFVGHVIQINLLSHAPVWAEGGKVGTGYVIAFPETSSLSVDVFRNMRSKL